MFCRNCGKEISDNSAVCNGCGTAVGHNASEAVATRQTGMYSKEEYLSISSEYAKEKKEVESKYKKKITTCGVTMGVCGVLLTVFLCAMFAMLESIGVLLTVILLFGSLGGMIGSAVVWQININKRKAELDELADKHYREYIKNFNYR